MALKTAEPKTERFVARVTPADKDVFQLASSLEGRSMATFVIAHARAAAEEILARNQTIRLTAEESRRFVEGLLAPARPVPTRLRKALRQHSRVVEDRD